MDFTAHHTSPFGGITLASDGTNLIGLWFDGQRFFGDTLAPAQEEKHDLQVFSDTRRWLDIYFAGRQPDFTPPLLLRTTDFRRRVCEIMLTIPFGHTMTYSEIARRMSICSAQAIGNAVGHNPISLIIPCHRVIGVDGSLTGYAAGLEKKSRLLLMERHGMEKDGEERRFPPRNAIEPSPRYIAHDIC